ncbi:MAG: hypothetical protein DHS80DRAFT_31675 [Piptocephalis tieghemiana]|nr:MAG: hypothetical protein DHS80DRAFT_31675 [Piptocephalis tieghemiana]
MPSHPPISLLAPYALSHPHLPRGLYYIPDFITEQEETLLMGKVVEAPRSKWVTLSRRRLQYYGGTPHAKGIIQEPLPSWVKLPFDRFDQLGIFPGGSGGPDHLLINEYHPGQGIMPHEDGPYYLPTVATISLGSHIILDLYSSAPPSPGGPSHVSILLKRRSLVILSEEAYTSWLHGIAERTEDARLEGMAKGDLDLWVDPASPSSCPPSSSVLEILQRSTRISLTYRQVANPIRIPKHLRPS